MTGAIEPAKPLVSTATDEMLAREDRAQTSVAATGGSRDRLVATSLRKAYGGQVVLDGIDLTFAAGSAIAIAGDNGAGKSTLLSCLAGTIRHDGRVLLDGAAVGPATKRRVAYLPQRLRLPSTASGHEVLRLFAAIGGGDAERATPPDGFLPDLDKPVGKLSGGQAQRVGLAAVLQGHPDLILLDEPFANLDDDGREQARELVEAHRASGAIVLVASPTAHDLLASVDRVVELGGGGVRFDGSADRYAGRMEMTMWVRWADAAAATAEATGLVRRHGRDGPWLVLDCLRDDAGSLLHELELSGIAARDVHFARPDGDGERAAAGDDEADR